MEYIFNNVKVESVRDGWFKSSVFNVFIGSNSFKHTELNSLNQDNIIRPSKKEEEVVSLLMENVLKNGYLNLIGFLCSRKSFLYTSFLSKG